MKGLHVEPPEIPEPEEGMGKFLVALILLLCVVACAGACIVAQMIDR